MKRREGSRMESLNWALRFLRSSRKLNQRQVAEALKIPPSTVSAWEMGRRQPSLERLGQLADLLELDLGDLDDALVLAGGWPAPRRVREVLLAPLRIAQELHGRADAGAGDPLAVVLTQLFALAARLRERGVGAPPDRGARPLGVSRMGTLADALYILRTSRQFRQSEIAASLEVHPSVVSGWEHGKGRPSLERFGQIADRLRLDLGELDDALERTARIGYHRRRPRRTLPDVDLEPVRIAAGLLGRWPGDRTDPAQAELQRLLEALFILVDGLEERSADEAAAAREG